MKNRLLIFFLMISFTKSFAQKVVTIKGNIVDYKNEKPLPFATVYNKALPCYSIADSAGNFQLTINVPTYNFYLVISSIGYYKDSVKNRNLSTTTFKTIKLKPDTANLPAAIIDAMTAKTIVTKAIELISENYLYQTFFFNSTYAQYHFERTYGSQDEKAVRLIFADADLSEEFVIRGKSKKIKEKAKVNCILRSDVFEKNKENMAITF